MVSIPNSFIEWVQMRGALVTSTPANLTSLRHITDHSTELRNAQALETSLAKGVSISTVTIPVTFDGTNVLSPGDCIFARTYTPSPTIGPYPLIIYFRPGLVSGDIDTEDVTCRQLCKLCTAVVLNVEYRKAPAHPYPVPLQDCWDAVKWAAANASKKLNADPLNRGLIVGGTSTGGLLASAVAIRARDSKLSPPITGLVLRSPITIHPDLAPSYSPRLSSFVDAAPTGPFPIYTTSLWSTIFETYAVPVLEQASPFVSPLLAPSFRGLPPVYIQLPTLSTSYSEAKAYAARLREAGVRVIINEYQDLPHCFWMLPRIKGAADVARDLARGVRWLESERVEKCWDTGMRESDLQSWLESTRYGEGIEAWKERKLCKREGCGCQV